MHWMHEEIGKYVPCRLGGFNVIEGLLGCRALPVPGVVAGLYSHQDYLTLIRPAETRLKVVNQRQVYLPQLHTFDPHKEPHEKAEGRKQVKAKKEMPSVYYLLPPAFRLLPSAFCLPPS